MCEPSPRARFRDRPAQGRWTQLKVTEAAKLDAREAIAVASKSFRSGEATTLGVTVTKARLSDTEFQSR
jgi:outer membrane protein TolC